MLAGWAGMKGGKGGVPAETGWGAEVGGGEGQVSALRILFCPAYLGLCLHHTQEEWQTVRNLSCAQDLPPLPHSPYCRQAGSQRTPPSSPGP